MSGYSFTKLCLPYKSVLSAKNNIFKSIFIISIRKLTKDKYVTFQSQYIAACDARREWLSGLSGSSGTALVTSSHALVWTDGRYFTQFYLQVDTGVWSLMRQGKRNNRWRYCTRRRILEFLRSQALRLLGWFQAKFVISAIFKVSMEELRKLIFVFKITKYLKIITTG